jgi:hypothetical protein
LNADHPARFIVEVVDHLDLGNLTRQYADAAAPPNHFAGDLVVQASGVEHFGSIGLQDA